MDGSTVPTLVKSELTDLQETLADLIQFFIFAPKGFGGESTAAIGHWP